MTATTETSGKAPWHLWVVGVVAVLFNAIGVFDYVMSKTQGADYLAAAGMSPAQVEHYLGLPLWMHAVWAIGVWSAFIASILILLRRKLAFPVFVLSLAAFLLSVFYNYVLSGAAEIMGTSVAISSTVITVLLVFFAWYSRRAAARGLLR